jgi:2-oxo-4-hydroxy-4-carboxy--5-ureidoimidazoline (OHCU) decarboxylase
MYKLDFAKDIINADLLESYIELSENDEVLSKAIDKTTDIPTLVNSLLAALICVVSREKYFTSELMGFLKAHPEMSQAIQSKQMKDSMEKEKAGMTI